jgi:signal transduction histidine kinase
VQTVQPEAESHGLTLSLEAVEGPQLAGDVDRLTQLFDNLLSNAVKFTPDGGSVSVSAAPADAGWRVVVTDDGMGIPADEQGQLFHRFFRASNAARRGVPGAGLGLSIAHAVVQEHGGVIEVCSAVGRGTTVTVEMAGITGSD